ncbi:MAG: methionine--tRNA ligase [Verrucomicrobia bacterium]|nr:methionine--tRNA ligase [Verrucomicrobiota bacterium]
MSTTKFYVTTPIYYVNDKPHIGHAYTTILADVLARYHRLLGHPTFFLTGTDEHGLKVQQAAEKAGITPQEQADNTVVRFRDLWEKLEITNDHFIRTTDDYHKKVVQDILQDLFDRDEIYKAEYDGWYDVTSETFVTEKDLPEGQKPEDLPNVTRIKETNYFFRMSKYQDWLIQHINDNPEFIQPDFRRNETLGFLRQPLNDLCISRPKNRLNWGIDLPFDRDFVCYVWFDALINYISGIGYQQDDKTFRKWWPADYHLIGKDILTTHTVYWPTMLKAADIPLPRTVFAHGWWLSGKTKMSKSLGNVVNPMDMIDRYGVDPFRYFLIAEMSLGQDASFTEEAFVRRYNSDLANDLGNLLSRLTNMITRYCDAKIPNVSKNVLKDDAEKELWDAVQTAVEKMEASVERMRLDLGIADVLNAIRGINRYLEMKQPWTQAREEDKAPLHTTLYCAAEALRVMAALLYPVMPGKMTALREALGLSAGEPDTERLRKWGLIKAGAAANKPAALFPRIEDAIETESKTMTDENAEKKTSDKPTAAPAEKKPEGVALISFEDFMMMDLRTGKILEAGKIEGADKLLRLQVMIGSEKRQVVAGIAQHYDADQLIGKTVVVVANLKPATIRGVESHGMLLAASKGESLRLVTIDGEISSGAKVK